MKCTDKLSDYLMTKAGRALIPMSGTFELSPVCNFACRMCYVRKTAKEVAESARPILQLDDWLRIAREAREQGLLYLLLTGGEPLLWPDFWELYGELSKMGFFLSVNTNGSLLDEEAVRRFRLQPPKRINITLYGKNDETYRRLCMTKGVFSRVDKGINSLLDAGINIKLNGSITPDNAADLEDMVSYAKSKKLIYQATSYMFPPVRRDPSMVGKNARFTPEEAAYYRLKAYALQCTPEQNREHLERIVNGTDVPLGLDESCVDPVDGQIRCRAGKASFWITWDGWLTPCGMMPEPKADVREMSFSDCWHQITADCAVLHTSGICSNCKNLELCHPCAAMAYTETGSVSGIPTYLCETVREMRRLALVELENNPVAPDAV